MKKIKILIVDDHMLVRDGIRALLALVADIEVVGEASNGKEAIDKVKELRPDVVLMDLAMPIMGGLEATRRIRKEFPETRVVALTQYDDSEYVIPVIEAGACGYVTKMVASSELTTAIQAAYTDHVDVLLNGCPHYLVGSLVYPGIDYFHTGVPQRPGHNLDASIMGVQANLTEQDSYLFSGHSGSSFLKRPKCRLSIDLTPRLISCPLPLIREGGKGDGFPKQSLNNHWTFVLAEDFPQHTGYLTNCGIGLNCVHYVRHQIILITLWLSGKLPQLI